jgi:hypothetical protein
VRISDAPGSAAEVPVRFRRPNTRDIAWIRRDALVRRPTASADPGGPLQALRLVQDVRRLAHSGERCHRESDPPHHSVTRPRTPFVLRLPSKPFPSRFWIVTQAAFSAPSYQLATTKLVPLPLPRTRTQGGA